MTTSLRPACIDALRRVSATEPPDAARSDATPSDAARSDAAPSDAARDASAELRAARRHVTSCPSCATLIGDTGSAERVLATLACHRPPQRPRLRIALGVIAALQCALALPWLFVPWANIPVCGVAITGIYRRTPGATARKVAAVRATVSELSSIESGIMPAYTLPDLSYDYSALEPWYSAEVLELHHSKHHAGYVKGANDTLEQLGEMRDSGDYSTLGMLQKNLAFHVSGHVLHSILWTNLTPNAPERPEGDLADAIDTYFGSLDAFKKQLSAATLGVQGSGWGALAWEPTAGRLIVEQIYDHQGNIGQAAVPLLVIDSWEHAFYLQYRNVKADWVDAFWHITNWDDVARRYTAAKTVQLPY